MCICNTTHQKYIGIAPPPQVSANEFAYLTADATHCIRSEGRHAVSENMGQAWRPVPTAPQSATTAQITCTGHYALPPGIFALACSWAVSDPAEARSNAHETASHDVPGATGWPSRASLHPSMYSALPAAGDLPQPWNARAGWVTGVCLLWRCHPSDAAGDVLQAMCVLGTRRCSCAQYVHVPADLVQ